MCFLASRRLSCPIGAEQPQHGRRDRRSAVPCSDRRVIRVSKLKSLRNAQKLNFYIDVISGLSLNTTVGRKSHTILGTVDKKVRREGF